MFYPTPRRGEYQAESGFVSWKAMFLYGFVATLLSLPIRYTADSRLHVLTTLASAQSDTRGYVLYQAVGEKWLMRDCQNSLTLRWPKNVVMVIPGQPEKVLLGLDKKGNKTAVSVQGLSGEFKTCSIQRVK